MDNDASATAVVEIRGELVPVKMDNDTEETVPQLQSQPVPPAANGKLELDDSRVAMEALNRDQQLPDVSIGKDESHGSDDEEREDVEEDDNMDEKADNEAGKHESVGDEVEDRVDNPSEDIRSDLADILENDVEFNGSFSFNRAYPVAPNPSMNIDGLGTVGLPLSARDAAAIKACAEQAPFGMADRTVVDRSVRDTWEINAHKVRFENPGWLAFMDQTVRDVCQVMGVNFEASRPRCELYKLLLYETGSHFLPHVDTEKANGMFATIVVVLPSKFTGGEVHVAHDGLSSTYDHSAKSLYETTVLAWYTDVQHEVKTITSGYRLALSFNLIHTTNSLRPAVKETNVAARLQHVLLSWKQIEGDGDAPRKIIYLLSHKYSQANMSGSALKGVDAHLIALLDGVGRTHGFHLGLANVICSQSGYADDHGRREQRRDRRWGYCGYDDSDFDDSDVDMAEVESTDVTIENLVDLNGNIIQESLEFEQEKEVIPEDLIDDVTSGDYDDQEYEGYMGNGAGSLERWYRRTVLVIWPGWANFDIIHGASGFSYACSQLRASTTLQPTPEETELTNIVLVRAKPSDGDAVVSSVCRVALTWKDLSLWFRAVKACNAEQSIKTLKADNIIQAVAAFGFTEVKSCIEHALKGDPSTVSSLQFLEDFESWVIGRSSGEFTALTTEWIAVQRNKRFDNLKDITSENAKFLTALTLKYRGLQFYEDTVLPLVRQLKHASLLLSYAVNMQTEVSIPPDTRIRIMKDLLRETLTKVNIYSATKNITRTPMYSALHHTAQSDDAQHLERAKVYIKACLDLGCEDLFPMIVARIFQRDELTASILERRVKLVFLPLIVYIGEIVRARGADRPLPGVHEFCEITATLYLNVVNASPHTLVQADLASVIQGVATCGQPELLFTLIVPKLENLPLQAHQWRCIMDEVRAKRALVDSPGANTRVVLLRVLKKWASIVDLTSSTYHSNSWGVPYVKPAMGALEYCFTLDLLDGCSYILNRLLNPPRLDAGYIKTQLAPLVPDLRASLIKHKQPLTSPVFAPVFRTIMLLWVQKVLGLRPVNTVKQHVQTVAKWTCNCDVCPHVRKFLTSEAADQKSWWRIGAPKRRHVEQYLASYARAIATWTTIRSTPQGLTVVKSKAMVEPARWAENQKGGLQLLKNISPDPAEAQAILGPQHANIMALLQGRSPPTNAAAPAAGPSSSTHAAVSQTPGGSSAVPNVNTAQPPAAFGTRPTPQALPATAQTGQAGLSTSTSARRVSSGLGDGAEPSAKRRKTAYDEKNVIDLT